MIVNPFSKEVADAMASKHVNMELAAEFFFSSGISRVHTGVGEVLIAGQVYHGLGSLGEVGSITEKNDTSPKRLSLTLSGLDNNLLGISLNEESVNRRVNVYVATFDDSFTEVSYNLLFRGKITSSSVVAGDKPSINYTLSSVFEDWSKGKPNRFTDESHRRRHGDDDRIFIHVGEMSERSIYWGSKKDAPAFRYGN